MVVPGTGVQFSEPGRPQFASEPARTQFAPSSSDFTQQQVSFQSLPPQGRDAPNYPAFAPQREGRTDGYSTGILKPPGTYSPQFAPQSSGLSPPRTITSPRAAFRDTASAQGIQSSGGLQDLRGVNSKQRLGSTSMSSARLGPRPAAMRSEGLPGTRTLTADDIFGQGPSGTRTINADEVGYASRREFEPRPMSRGGSLQAVSYSPPSPPTQFRTPIEPMIPSEQDLGPSLRPVQETSPMPTSLK